MGGPDSDCDGSSSSSSSDEETEDPRMSSFRTTRPPLAALPTNAPAPVVGLPLSKAHGHAAVDKPMTSPAVPVPTLSTLQRVSALKAHAELLLSDEA